MCIGLVPTYWDNVFKMLINSRTLKSFGDFYNNNSFKFYKTWPNFNLGMYYPLQAWSWSIENVNEWIHLDLA